MSRRQPLATLGPAAAARGLRLRPRCTPRSPRCRAPFRPWWSRTKSPGLAGFLSGSSPASATSTSGSTSALRDRCRVRRSSGPSARLQDGHAGEFFGPLIAFIWFFGIIDAVRQAKAINRGQLAESGLRRRSRS